MLSRRGFLGLSLGAVAGLVGAGFVERTVTQQWKVIEYKISVRVVRLVDGVLASVEMQPPASTALEPQVWSIVGPDGQPVNLRLSFNED